MTSSYSAIHGKNTLHTYEKFLNALVRQDWLLKLQNVSLLLLKLNILVTQLVWVKLHHAMQRSMIFKPFRDQQLQSFLGLAGYYRKFIPHFAYITACLTDMLKKGIKFVWSEEAEAAFLDIKSWLTSRPILRPPDLSRPFCIAVDASDEAIGACLFQVVDGIEHPVTFYSKKLSRWDRTSCYLLQ